MNKPSEKISTPQILFGLHDILLDATGTDEIFTADTPVIAYLRAHRSWWELDLSDLFVQIEEFFAFRCRLSEWEELFGRSIARRSRRRWEREFVPEFTFRVLAEFIARRAQSACEPSSDRRAPLYGANSLMGPSLRPVTSAFPLMVDR